MTIHYHPFSPAKCWLIVCNTVYSRIRPKLSDTNYINTSLLCTQLLLFSPVLYKICALPFRTVIISQFGCGQQIGFGTWNKTAFAVYVWFLSDELLKLLMLALRGGKSLCQCPQHCISAVTLAQAASDSITAGWTPEIHLPICSGEVYINDMWVL